MKDRRRRNKRRRRARRLRNIMMVCPKSCDRGCGQTKRCAEELGRSLRTVQHHLSNLRRRFGHINAKDVARDMDVHLTIAWKVSTFFTSLFLKCCCIFRTLEAHMALAVHAVPTVLIMPRDRDERSAAELLENSFPLLPHTRAE